MPSLITMRSSPQSVVEEDFAPAHGGSCNSRQSPLPALPAHSQSQVDRAEAALQLEAMLLRERSPDLRPRDYLSLVFSSSSPPSSSSRATMPAVQINRSCRTKMVRWMYDVVDYCEFDRESAYVASSHLDRFLSSSSAAAFRAARDKRTYQLAALSCLYLAIKTVEPRTVLSPESVSDLSDGEYSEGEIVEMEGQVLRALGWRVHGPTAAEFASYLLVIWNDGGERCRKRDEKFADLIRYQVEISALDYKLSSLCRPSVVAAAAVCNALDLCDDSSHEAAESFLRSAVRAAGESSISAPQVNSVRDRLVKMLRKARTSSMITPKVSCAEVSAESSAEESKHCSSGHAVSPVCVTSHVHQRIEEENQS